ncbi:hypothetical protein D3C71_1732740 [compost metagenome]
MAVAGRDLAGQDQLQSCVQALRDAGLARQAGVLQDEDAAHGFFGGDERAGRHDVVAHVVVLPEGRYAARGGLAGHQIVQGLPQGGHVLFGDARVIGGAISAAVGSVIGAGGMAVGHACLQYVRLLPASTGGRRVGRGWSGYGDDYA